MTDLDRHPLGDPLLASEPLYKQVKDSIIRSLTSDEWKSGELIPSESRLAERYGVSISTVRAAIGELVSARVLSRKQGKGTFVSPHSAQRSVYQFFHVVRNDGARELPVSQLLSLKRARAEPGVAEALQLPRSSREADVFRIRNMLRVAGRPVSVSDISVPIALFTDLSKTVIEEAGRTLYALYQSRYGVNIIATSEKLRAVKAASDVAELLGVPEQDPVLEIERLAFTFGKRPIEARRSWVVTTDFHYLINQHEN